jgi:hypothetical protein
MPVADEGASYPATGTTDAAPNTSLSTAAYFGSAGFFRSSSATFFAEVPFATLAGQGDETAASSDTAFGFFAFSIVEMADAKGADC